MSGILPEQFLQVAKVLKSNGTDGDILLSFRDMDSSDIPTEEPVFVYFDGLPVPFFFSSFQRKGPSRAVAHIAGVDSLEDADEMAGRAVYMDEGLFEEEVVAEDGLEYFEGVKVLSPDGEVLGEVSGYEDIPGNPCLYLRRPSGDEVLIPFHEDFVVDATEDTLCLDLPDGILGPGYES